jgi:predicted amidohydrolase
MLDKRAIAEADGDGPVQRFLSQQARELGLWIVGGTTPIAQEPGGRVAAACLVYADDGRRAARYDKMHLFDVDLPGRTESYRESANTAPGARAVLVPTPAGLLGLSVCYDMRFPELYRQLSAAGAQWFSIPSAFTVPTGRRTGRCCCAAGRSRTCPMWLHRRSGGAMPAAARPTATV